MMMSPRLRSLHLGAALFLSIISIASPVSYPSHTETEQYTVTVPYRSCTPYACNRVCYPYYCGRRCRYTDTCQCCTTAYTTRQETRTKCQQKWSGPNCDIPTCTRPCTDGRSCVPADQCECVASGSGVCTAVGCTGGKSCYPGTCSSGNCNCPPQFNGTNCEKIRLTPNITNCQVKLFTGNPEREVAQAHCAVEGHAPELTWVGEMSFSRVEAWWEATYLNPYKAVLPTQTLHIAAAEFGVTHTNADVTVSSSSFPNPIGQRILCENDHLKPMQNVKCSSKTIKWTKFGKVSLSENSTIEVKVFALLGGYKKLKISGTNEEISGSSATERRVLFAVDAKPPVHCRQDRSCNDPAIYLEQDAVKSAAIEGECYNWVDSESGIDSYHLKLYRLLKSSSDVLQTPQRPEKELTVTSGSKFTLTFPSPGVYSIELTVFDKARNPSRARKIVLYDNENRIAIANAPFVVTEASMESGYRWITSPLRDEAGTSRLTLSWKGRYANAKHVSEGWLYRVDTLQNWIDDDLLNEGGNRTIHEVKHSSGIVGYRLAFQVDKHSGYGLKPGADFREANGMIRELEQSTWGGYGHDQFQTTLVMPNLTPNDTVIIWIQAFDVVGNFLEDRIRIGFDTSAPELDVEAPPLLRINPNDPHKSRVEIKAHDMQSGIEVVEYWITISYQTANITSGRANATRLKSDSGRQKSALAICKRGSVDCYCIMNGDCFEYIIHVDIDHCDIDRHYRADQPMTFSYVVINQAGQSVAPRRPLILKFEGEPKCRSVTVFTAGTLLAIIIGLLILLILIILVIFMVLRWKQHKHPIPDKVRNIASSVRQRITHTEKVHSADGHAIYRSKTRRSRLNDYEDDDIYVDGSDPGGWRVKRDQVELADTLATGRFATVKKAYLKKGGQTVTVAAKYLPADASDADKALLRAKIAFHGNRVPPHDNIVRLVGVIDEGPYMLLEFCDLTLKEWLNNVGTVTVDVLENMLGFTTNIASGMEFLHSKNILHRRLAIRNVLLKKDGMSGLVAKLIGFGSFNDSGTDDQAEESSNVAVPLKWLAPETLESVGKRKAIYTQKSDVWSYGITVWEIYSIGATPYADQKSAQVEGLLKTGYRMPRPGDCPVELFDTVVTPCWNIIPKKRPDFKTLLKSIRSFRTGGGDQQEGYYTADPTRKGYDNPKERTTAYNPADKGRSATAPEALYDDTRK